MQRTSLSRSIQETQSFGFGKNWCCPVAHVEHYFGDLIFSGSNTNITDIYSTNIADIYSRIDVCTNITDICSIFSVFITPSDLYCSRSFTIVPLNAQSCRLCIWKSDGTSTFNSTSFTTGILGLQACFSIWLTHSLFLLSERVWT